MNKLEKIPDNSILITMGVCSLHTNIQHKDGITVVETILKRKNKPTRFMTTFLKIILTLNIVMFNCKNYLQIKGCTMCTKCTPTYAKMFVERFEENTIYHLIQGKCILYLRYIDNIFLIWTETFDKLNKIVAKINQVYPLVKFDFNYSSNSVIF